MINSTNIYLKRLLTRAASIAIALVCLFGAAAVSAQSVPVKGKVVDNSGEAMVGALVRGNTSNRAAISDANGAFTIAAASGETLTVSLVGYRDAVVPTTDRQPVITLEPELSAIDEVVVVGYGSQRRATLTGSVSSVSNKEIAVTKNENVVNMLSGKIPGVRITQTSSQPGNYDSSFKIDIRGMGEPMIVVDGIPRDKGYFARMDASEIDNVSVLKDAAAAIYGVQAGNGVLLVTTKRGSSKEGKFNITVSANYGWQNFLYIPETSSAVDHMLMINEKTFNGINQNYPVRTTPRFTWDQMLEYMSTPDKKGKPSTNWNDEIFQSNVPQHQFNVSMDGGTDRVSYFFNVGQMEQMGSYKSGSLNYNRWNFRSNVDVRITNRLKAAVSMGGYLDERNEPNTDIWTVYKNAWIALPTSAAWEYDTNGQRLPSGNTQLPDNGTSNPAAATNSIYSGFRRFKNANVNGSLALTYEIPGVKGLNVRALYDYTYTNQDNTEYRRQYSLYRPNTDGTFTQTKNAVIPNVKRTADPGQSELMQLSLNYANKFGDHSVGTTLVWEERAGRNEGFWAQRTMLLDSPYMMNGEAEDAQGVGNNPGEWARKALVGRATYDWKGRYMAELAFRYDGASNFSKAGAWGFFPSALVAWRMSEEKFMKNLLPFVTNFKWRFSYGQMGRDEITRRAVMGYTMNPSSIDYVYGESVMAGLKPNETPNPDLTWLIINTMNAGMDFDLWNGKLTGSVDVFRRVREGIPRRPDTQLPEELGAQLPEVNTDSDATFGWEFTLGHRGRYGDFTYYADAQISGTKNRWVYRQDSRGSNSYDVWHRRDASGRNKDIWFSYEEGGRFGSYDEIRYHGTTGANLGQNTLPGDYWYEDWNGDGTVNDEDRHPIATYNLPAFNYGLSMGASWKGIDLSMQWQGAAGVYNKYNEVFNEVGPFNGGAALDIYKDRWHTADPAADPWNPNTQWIQGYYPATGHSFSTGSTGIRNSSYVRLKTLELGYTLPQTWVAKVGVRDLRVYVNGYNLLTFSMLKNIDPERPGFTGGANNNADEGVLYYNYPVNRTFNIGASLKF